MTSESRLTGALAIELWRSLRSSRRSAEFLPADRAEKSLAQIRFVESRIERLLEEAGYRFKTFDGERFSASLPVVPMNLDDVPDDEDPVIKETIEPTLLRKGKVVHVGKVIV